ncbi:DUF2306 domain-containing protein [Sphingomonas floccifaciens]|uniref:DUF2306 domain-containing protein n=1 Tax=Sphingomonas floccifaciens TaxID=1844115 RepID=A0ABW4NDB6_9SPHN
MATIIGQADAPPARRNLAPDTYERILSGGAVILLIAILAALWRGREQFDRVPGPVWLHLATITLAVALTPVLLLGRRGARRHRTVGTIWVVAMLATAASSFLIREIANGRPSLIHVLSAWTLFQVPLLWWLARTHQVERHRRAVRALVTGALLVAGFFTFPFNRLLGHWLFG